MTKLYQIFVVVVIMASAVLRVILIDQIPPATFIDEFNLATPAAQISLGSIYLPWSGFGWYATPGLFFHYVGWLFQLFGISITTIKLAWMVPAIITLPVIYLLAKTLFNSKFVAMMTLIIFGFNTISVHISRWGHGSVITAFFQPVVLLLFWLGSTTKKSISYFYIGSSALFAGLSLYFYVGARSFVFLLPLLIIWYWIFSSHAFQKKVASILLFLLILLVVVSPIAIQLGRDQFNFIWRIQEVSIIQTSQSPTTNLLHLLQNLLVYFGVLFNMVDPNLRHNPLQTTLFPYYLGLLVPIGLIVALGAKATRKSGIFLLLGIIATLAGGLLSTEAPSYFRTLGSIPLFAICVAVTLNQMTQKLNKKLIAKNSRFFIYFIALSAVGFALLLKLTDYYQFMLKPNQAMQEAFSFPEQKIAEAVVGNLGQHKQIFIDSDYLYSSTIFLTLPKNAHQEYQLFDIDDLLNLNKPAVLVLENSAAGLRPFLNTYFTITDFTEIQTGQTEQPIVYDLLPLRSASQSAGLSVVCDDGQHQFPSRESLGIFHSLDTFPANIVNCIWRGELVIEQAGDFVFRGKADDSLSLQLADSSGKIILNQLPRSNWQSAVSLEAGIYQLVAEYQNQGGARHVRLEWLQPNTQQFLVIDPLLFNSNQVYE